MAHTLTLLFVGLLAFSSIIRYWLGTRQINFVQENRKAVPAAFAKDIALDAHQKAADYTTAKTKLGLFEMLVQAALLFILTIGGGLQWIDTIWSNILPNHDILRGALVICSALLVSSIVDLPFEYYKTFVVDEKFGFNKMTPAMFLSDLVKHSVVGLLLGAPILFAALWLMQSAGEYWWLYLWVLWTV
ncbi:MAG: STE24 endopeptidase, partial [Methylophilaceae bacterium]